MSEAKSSFAAVLLGLAPAQPSYFGGICLKLNYEIPSVGNMYQLSDINKIAQEWKFTTFTPDSAIKEVEK